MSERKYTDSDIYALVGFNLAYVATIFEIAKNNKKLEKEIGKLLRENVSFAFKLLTLPEVEE